MLVHRPQPSPFLPQAKNFFHKSDHSPSHRNCIPHSSEILSIQRPLWPLLWPLPSGPAPATWWASEGGGEAGPPGPPTQACLETCSPFPSIAILITAAAHLISSKLICQLKGFIFHSVCP